MRANLNEKNLNFVDFFAIDECGTVIQGGRMQYNHNNHDGLLFTTGDNYADSPNGKSQKINSIFGKVIFKPFNDSKYEIFSLGHRNPQGLFVENELILMTEHGPKGGDEINRMYLIKIMDGLLPHMETSIIRLILLAINKVILKMVLRSQFIHLFRL